MHNQYVIFRSYDEVLEARKEAELKELEERKKAKEMTLLTPSYLASLSIKELKEKLTKWKVDISTCLEKQDLVAIAVEYVANYHRNKETELPGVYHK